MLQLPGNEKMNCEEQAVDLCNAIDLCNVPDNTTSPEILPRDTLDGDQGERDAAVLARLKDLHLKDDGSTELKAPHSKNNGSIAVSADPFNGSAGDLQQSLSKFEEPPVINCSVEDGSDEADDGEMDIGVDLSLDENGVLELEPASTQREESASSVNSQISVIELHSQERRDDDVPVSATTPDEGVGIKHGSKRVTFPSDEDIVSGAVEPKDPWRHGEWIFQTVNICVSDWNLNVFSKCDWQRNPFQAIYGSKSCSNLIRFSLSSPAPASRPFPHT